MLFGIRRQCRLYISRWVPLTVLPTCYHFISMRCRACSVPLVRYATLRYAVDVRLTFFPVSPTPFCLFVEPRWRYLFTGIRLLVLLNTMLAWLHSPPPLPSRWTLFTWHGACRWRACSAMTLFLLLPCNRRHCYACLPCYLPCPSFVYYQTMLNRLPSPDTYRDYNETVPFTCCWCSYRVRDVILTLFRQRPICSPARYRTHCCRLSPAWRRRCRLPFVPASMMRMLLFSWPARFSPVLDVQLAIPLWIIAAAYYTANNSVCYIPTSTKWRRHHGLAILIDSSFDDYYTPFCSWNSAYNLLTMETNDISTRGNYTTVSAKCFAACDIPEHS